MADIFQNLKDAWARANTGANQLDDLPMGHFFQYRQTGVPGRIKDLSHDGPWSGGSYGNTGGDPANAVYAEQVLGPRQDAATTWGLAALRPLWEKRTQANPNESMINIDPRAINNSSTYAHEAAHSLFGQILGSQYSGPQVERLNQQVPNSGIHVRFAYPGNEATEATAYLVGEPWNNASPRSLAFLQSVVQSAQTPQQKAAAAQLLKLFAYTQRRGL